ncbi:hypothetical protein [Streptomyces sp. NPDC058872]|uniref:hypothetical protein n=1 Tax=Streptomyces sp. NPDC058872 TaxID=3346661 RepID=UPI0036C0B9EE
MNRWTAYGTVVAGAMLLALDVSGTITTIPYSIFAVLVGTGLVVDGMRRALHLRRRRNPRTR